MESVSIFSGFQGYNQTQTYLFLNFSADGLDVIIVEGGGNFGRKDSRRARKEYNRIEAGKKEGNHIEQDMKSNKQVKNKMNE